ncbi:hypothetical protein O5D80_004953 [Batrachochytrium dendrobatidis]|nr:hypothetical protein O5D80_004953 [Batrachochytrium dendrobatidis]
MTSILNGDASFGYLTECGTNRDLILPGIQSSNRGRLCTRLHDRTRSEPLSNGEKILHEAVTENKDVLNQPDIRKRHHSHHHKHVYKKTGYRSETLNSVDEKALQHSNPSQSTNKHDCQQSSTLNQSKRTNPSNLSNFLLDSINSQSINISFHKSRTRRESCKPDQETNISKESLLHEQEVNENDMSSNTTENSSIMSAAESISDLMTRQSLIQSDYYSASVTLDQTTVNQLKKDDQSFSLNGTIVNPIFTRRNLSILKSEIYLPSDISPACFLWKYAIRSALDQLKSADFSTLVQRHQQKFKSSKPEAVATIIPSIPYKPDTQPELDPRQNMKPHDSPKQIIAAMQIHRILQMHAGIRKEQDIDTLDTLLGAIPCFSKLSTSIRMLLFSKSRFERHSKSTRIISKGHTTSTMYIVLLGECRQHQDMSSKSMYLKQQGGMMSFTAGMSFGEFTNQTGPRLNSVTCTVLSEVMAIDKSDWIQAMKEAKSIESYEVNVLAAVPLLSKVPRPILGQIGFKCVLRKFLANSDISLAGDISSNLFFILKGKCKIKYQVPFVKTRTALSTEFKHKYVLQAYRGQKLETEVDEMVYEMENVGELYSGDYFPQLGKNQMNQLQLEQIFNPTVCKPLVLSESVSGNMDSRIPSSVEFAEKLEKLSPWLLLQPPINLYTIVSTDVVECVMIPRSDIIAHLPFETIRQLISREKIMFPSEIVLNEAQDKYLTHNGWWTTDEDIILTKLNAEMTRDRVENLKSIAIVPKIGLVSTLL